MPAIFDLQSAISTIIAAVISAYACAAVAQYGTPIDAALPLIAIVVTILAAITRPAIQVAVPLLIGGEIVLGDERLRLLWFGLVIGAAFAAALLECGGSPSLWKACTVAVLAVVLLRCIPFANVILWREGLLILVALLIVVALRGTAFAVAVAVAVALFTPLVPLRTIGFPLAVLLVLVAFRAAGMPQINAGALSATAVAVMMLFFAWSGVFARALPMVIRGLRASTPRAPLRMALAPGESVSLDVPPDASALILSGANISRLRAGTVAGALNNVPIRVGDVADWGFLRREHFYASRNPIPANPAGEVRDYGQNAWIDGAARFPLGGERVVRVTADPRLPRAARLQIDAFELVSR